MNPTDRRALLEAIAQIPAKHRAWLEKPDFELWCYYGWGVIPNDAQLSVAADIFERFPPGTIHVLRWANRTGKTTGLSLMNLYALWWKWRYMNADLDDWLGYRYRTLHAAPLGRLMGKAWEIADALIAGTAPQQRSPITNRQRPGLLRPFYSAGKGSDASGSDTLFVTCANGAIEDYLSTHDGAGRLESEAWWLITWDEFPRQQPVTDVPLMLDQTFLPRSSDFMAPLLLSGTATEDSDAVYGEIEDMAEANPRDWNFTTAARTVNFSQSQESIDRQLRLSMNAEVAGRSVLGLSGQGGFGLFPTFLLDNCFVDELPEHAPRGAFEEEQLDVRFYQAFDHALKGDENVVHTLAVPWPPDPSTLLLNPIIGAREAILRSSRTLTPSEQQRFLAAEAAAYQPQEIIVDATSEGGLGVFREAKSTGMPVLDCAFTARLPGVRVSNKEFALQALQRLLSWGLPIEIDADTGWVTDWPEPTGPFGALRLPKAWKRTRRQMSVYKRFDEKLTQDRVMTLAMLAWRLIRYYERAQKPQTRGFNVMARRQRGIALRGAR